MSSYTTEIHNEAADRFEGLDLAERIVGAIDDDDIVLDGDEWFIKSDDLDPEVFYLENQDGEKVYRVSIHCDIQKLGAE